MSISQYIDEINKASRHGKLVFFVGAGLSSLSGYPRWAELVDVFYKRLYGKDIEEKLTSDDYLRIPQIFYDVLEEHQKNQYDEILKEVFDVEKMPNPIHYKILSLNPVHIITTNYDDLLEKTCWQRGKYYTKISAEKDVSGATSSRYLVKVHGDFSRGFKADNVVLKESDYMSYDQNYPLISNLMKTIMATHTIVFIGYGLGDYNINLLLNWVKHLQKEGYKKPFFIRTDVEPIGDIDIKYYENKGLRIIDSTTLVKTEKNEYLKRYNVAMDMIIDYRNTMGKMTDAEIVDLIHSKIQPLTVLEAIRKIDLKYVFDEDYFFDLSGLILNNRLQGQDYLKSFFEITQKDHDDFSDDTIEKYKKIVNFFSENNIHGMADNSTGKQIKIVNNIENSIYNADYAAVEKLVKNKTDQLKEIYQQAFYLAILGEWEKAYEKYSEVIAGAIERKNLWLHFLSQVNRYHLYQSIKQTNRYLGSMGRLTYGVYYRPFSEEFLDKVESELKNFKISDLFQSMPEEFQEEYKILEYLSDNQFLYDDTVKLFELTNKVRTLIQKGSVSLGFSAENQVLIRLYETVRFLYENHMWSVSFSEFNQYAKNAMTLQFEKAEFDLTRDTNSFGFVDVVGRSSFHIDYFDFILISKSFKIEDIRFIERSCDINRINFVEEDRIENYLLRLIDMLESHYKNDTLQMNILFYNSFISEVKSAVYFARYVSLSSECIIRLINTVLYLIPLQEIDNGKKYLWCDRLTMKSKNLPESAILLIEKFLLKEAQNHKDLSYSEMTSNSLSSVNFAPLIHHYFPNYVSSILSEYALSIDGNSTKEINYLYKLSKILTKEARSYLFKNKSIESISDVIDYLKAGDVKSISEYDGMIVDFVSSRISDIKNDKEKRMVHHYADNYLVEFAAQYFMGEIKNEKLKEFKGVADEYDMFIDPECFDYSKFDPVWLKHYSDKTIQKMAENENMRINIVNILKDKLADSKDHLYLKILLKHFV